MGGITRPTSPGPQDKNPAYASLLARERQLTAEIHERQALLETVRRSIEHMEVDMRRPEAPSTRGAITSVPNETVSSPVMTAEQGRNQALDTIAGGGPYAQDQAAPQGEQYLAWLRGKGAFR